MNELVRSKEDRDVYSTRRIVKTVEVDMSMHYGIHYASPATGIWHTVCPELYLGFFMYLANLYWNRYNVVCSSCEITDKGVNHVVV